MSAKILIMSGARAGEEVVLDQDEFRAGGQPGCEVYFDAAKDPGAQGRAAGFQRKDEGWFVRNVGIGQIWLNAAPVAAYRQIRSGDIVRMSDDGPDLEFTIVNRSARTGKIPGEIVFDKDGRFTVVSGSAPAGKPIAALVASLPAGVQSPLTPEAAGPASPLASPAPPATSLQPAATASASLLAGLWGPGRRHLTPTTLVAAGVAAAAILVALFVLFHTRGTLPSLKLQSVPEKTAEVGSPIQFRVRVSDPAWEKKVRFGVGAHVPPCAAIDGATGEFSWTPAKAGEYEFQVEAVALDGSQQQSDTSLAFHVTRAKDAEPARVRLFRPS